MTALHDLPGTRLLALFARRELSPSEYYEHLLAHIQRWEPHLNALYRFDPQRIREQAAAATERWRKGQPKGPLDGLPVTIKELIATAGEPIPLGSAATALQPAPCDAPPAARLREAGAIVLAKTTVPDFGMLSSGLSSFHGVTRNPWNLAMTPGGSSGGSGAAVAAGCVSLAEGSDMGGSVRIPAALCGVVGMKPSLGRIPMDILPTVFDNISHFGPLARNVADAAQFLSVCHGPHERDISSLPDKLDFDGWQRQDLGGLRIALSTDLGFYALDDDVEANCRSAASALVEQGAIVDEVQLPWDRSVVDAWSQNWKVYLAASFAGEWEAHREQMNPQLVDQMEQAKHIGAVELKRLEQVRTQQWYSLCEVFERYDALLCPTMALPAQAAELDDSDYDSDDPQGRYQGFDMTSVFNNISQCPVLSVPSGVTRDGLPTAVQIVGRRFQDLAVLQIGERLEAELGIADARPAI